MKIQMSFYSVEECVGSEILTFFTVLNLYDLNRNLGAIMEIYTKDL